ETLSYCSGPGVGVVDGKGRIVMPFNANGASAWYNYLVISDDNG
ncbi:MAG TPA: exo-alpha-sialidase, partial [Porphyromonadaceae bacterium]|nr:exo-alpha-sialidase [Porphyromonadaceae bacterium]